MNVIRINKNKNYEKRDNIMCVIAYLPANKKANKVHLQNCFDNNPNGTGFMYQDKKNQRVIIRKGFMSFNEFWAEFERVPWNVDRVVHFRIATSGKVDRGCCHPFPLCDDYKYMRRERSVAKVGVAHNGVISYCTPKDGLSSIFSDTMMFVKNYMFQFDRENLFKPEIGEIIERATNSKFAVMNHMETALMGFFEYCDEDGCYYSNDSWEFVYRGYVWKGITKVKVDDKKFLTDYADSACNYGEDYNFTYGEDEEDEKPARGYRIAFTLRKNDCADWKVADFLAKKLEDSNIFVDDYWMGKGCAIFNIDKLPKTAKFYGHTWYQLNYEDEGLNGYTVEDNERYSG